MRTFEHEVFLELDCFYKTGHHRMKLRTINFMLRLLKQQREILLFTTKYGTSAHETTFEEVEEIEDSNNEILASEDIPVQRPAHKCRK